MSYSPEKIGGVGLGLRFPHFNEILKFDHEVPWFEVMTDDFLEDGPHHRKLEILRESKPIAFHSVGLNIGGVQEFDKKYLKKFKELYEFFQPELVTDHLCWSAHKGQYHHDLLPIPRTEEALQHVAGRITYLQDYFGRHLAFENITIYIDFRNSEFSEIEFLKKLVKLTGCGLLLDISNVVINHKNRELDYSAYFSNFPLESVAQIHVAGSDSSGSVIILSLIHI